MNITIQVNDGGAMQVPAGGDSRAASPAAAGDTADAGAPRLGATSTAPGSTSGSGDMVDIGGPPAWLREALDKSGKGVAAADSSLESAQAQNGGAGPSA